VVQLEPQEPQVLQIQVPQVALQDLVVQQELPVQLERRVLVNLQLQVEHQVVQVHLAL
jgi:hypothetical protein